MTRVRRDVACNVFLGLKARHNSAQGEALATRRTVQLRAASLA